MYIRKKYSARSKHPTLQIVEGYRVGKKVRQRTVASLGVVKSKSDLKRLEGLAKSIIRRFEKEGLPFEDEGSFKLDDIRHLQTEYDGFRIVTEKILDLIGFSNVVSTAQGRRTFNLQEIITLLISSRLHLPSSKLRSFLRQEDYGFYGIDLQHIYRTMDTVLSVKDAVQKQGFKAAHETVFDEPVDCLFFDVTTLYFESVEKDSLKDFGFSKDQKHHSVQIVLALVVDKEGIPLAYETFRGNTAETKTLIPVLKTLRDRFEIDNVTVVCDRGLSSKNNVQALWESGFNFVVACKLRQLPKKLEVNNLKKFKPLRSWTDDDGKLMYQVLEHPNFPDCDLVVTYSQSRANKDKKDRERLLEKLNAKLESGQDKTSVKKMISNSGYKKFTNVKEGSQVTLNEKAIKDDEEWDGFHGIAVSRKANLGIAAALNRYRSLWRVEEAFRVAKCTLETRPVFHWTPERIEGHILICFMTLYVERFLELMLRRAKTPLTPDRIRYALSKVHTIHIENNKTGKRGKVDSSISEDADKIFSVLNIPRQHQKT